VTREGTRPLAALIAAVLAVGLLAACGNSDSNSSSSTDASTPSGSSTATDATAQNNQQGGSSERGQKQREGGGHNDSHSQSHQGGDNGSSGRTVEEVETPLKVSGGGSAQFRTKGGDNSIQEFGEEADESELQEAAEVVHGFYISRAAEEWSKACSYLAKSNAEQLQQLVSQASKGKGSDCATALETFTQPLPVAVEREITTVDAGSLRHEGEQGFLIYRGADHVTYSMPLRNEGGTWKVAALSGTTLG
jgi:hypothetical protein